MILLLATLSDAGGYYLGESGIIASGRAGAWIAGADSQFAQYHNPAGLIRVDAPEISVGVSGVRQSVHFTRTDGSGASLPAIRNQDPAFAIPELGFATPIGDKAAFAFGFTSPFAPSYQYPRDGAQRYAMVDSDIWQFAFGPSFAVKPTRWFSVGASLGAQFLRVEERLVVTTSGPGSDGRDLPQGDIEVWASTWDRAQPWWNLGILVEPDPRVSIGLSLTPPATFVARGPGELDFAGHSLENSLDQVVWRDDDVAITVALPVILKGGVAVRPRENLEIELAATWERWSTLADLEVADIDVTVTSEAFNLARAVPPELSLPSDFRDVVTVRLGAEWRVDPALELRTGIAWDRGALSPQKLSVALVDPWKVQPAVGCSAFLLKDRLRLDGMATILVFPSLDIDDSEVTQTAIPVLTDAVTEGVVGNGQLKSLAWTAGLRASWILVAHRRADRQERPRSPANTP